MKATTERHPDGYLLVTIQCPGCRQGFHSLPISGTGVPSNMPSWSFNGSVNSPTLSPSVRCTLEVQDRKEVCHFFVRSGKLDFCGDSTHKLSGMSVDLVDL